MEIGDNILYLHQGKKQWSGTRKDIIYSKDELLNKFIFASEFLQDAKQMRMLEDDALKKGAPLVSGTNTA